VFRLFYTIFLFILILQPCQAEFKWDIDNIHGEEYVSTDNLKEYYRFDEYSTTGEYITLRVKRPDMTIEMKIRKGHPDLYVNGVRFVMSFPSTYSNGAHRVSRIDQSRLIDPVIQPKRIKLGKLFHTVIIDPGHGGQDTGTPGPYGHEKIFNLALGLKLKTELESRGFRVRMTRSDDSFPAPSDRTDYANRIDDAIFISLHFNSSSSSGVNGIETYAMTPKGTTSTNGGSEPADAKAYQGNMRDQENIALATAVHAYTVKRCDSGDRGIKRARFAVLAGINCPAVLIEGGFLSNREEARKIASPAYQAKMAAAIAEGIDGYRNALRRR
jgi:N-acetylmuramoyl-L-alanine amidase